MSEPTEQRALTTEQSVYLADGPFFIPPEARERETADPFRKRLVDDGTLRSLGIDTAKLGREGACRDRDFQKAHGVSAMMAQLAKLHPTRPEPEPTGDDDQLAKVLSPQSRRRRILTDWMQGELALGKSAQELIDYAAQHSPETAGELREIAASL
jgi:hypothetical protein